MMSFGKFVLLAISSAALLLLGASQASAFGVNSIYLTPPDQSVVSGGTFDVNLVMNFDDVTSGGGVEITFDPLVLFQSFSFDPAFTQNFVPITPVDGETTQPLNIGFGFFVPVAPYGEVGLHTIGTLTFQAVGIGTTQMITTGASALGTSPGPFYSSPGATLLPVNFSGASVSILPIPEPSTAILLGLGLILASATGRRD